MSSDILIVDDEDDIRNLVKGILEDEGYSVRSAEGSSSAYKEIEECLPSLIVLDIWLQGSEHDGLEILESVKSNHPNIPVIMISGHGSIETAVSSIQKGAYDFIEKPFKSDRLLLMVKRALENAELRRENETLKQRSDAPQDLVGESVAMQQLKQILERAAPTNSRVLITGEAGTGKDIAAHVLHRFSERSDQPYLTLSCATLRPERLETELFGSVGGPEGEIMGVLEQANNGTLLLDEVADMPLETQGKIVRVLQEQRFQKVGSNKSIEVDVRILASTNRDLEQAMQDGEFRQDLYYRLNVVPIHMPSLKERREDIPALVEHISLSLYKQSGLEKCSFSSAALAIMQAYDWPGNVRQLHNAIEWALIMNGSSEDKIIKPEQLPPEIYSEASSSHSLQEQKDIGKHLMGFSLREAREMFEKEYLQSQINRFGGNISQTAKFIGMERSALHRKLKSLEILSNNKEEKATETQKRKRA